jgi:hypothetical protein
LGYPSLLLKKFRHEILNLVVATAVAGLVVAKNSVTWKCWAMDD